MKDKIKEFVKRGFDKFTHAALNSLARAVQSNANAQHVMSAPEASQEVQQPTVIEPDSKLKLEGGYEATMYLVQQSHISPMIVALKKLEYVEVTTIANKDIDYVVGSENYWLTVGKDCKQYHVSPRTWPPLWSCYALPDPDVPRG